MSNRPAAQSLLHYMMTWERGGVRQGTDETEKLACDRSLIPETGETEKKDRARATGFEFHCELVNHSLEQCLIGIRIPELLRL